jgi:hypothetical protein
VEAGEEEDEDDLEMITDQPPGQFPRSLLAPRASSLTPCLRYLLYMTAFTGAPALTSAQMNAVEMLLGSKQAYFNAKRDEEWACLTAYLNTVLSWLKVVRSFTTWPDLLARLEGWNPYKERPIAKNLTARKRSGEPIYRPDGTMHAALAQYKIPKGQGNAKNPPPLARKLPSGANSSSSSKPTSSAHPKKKGKGGWKKSESFQWKSVIKMAKTLVEVKEAMKEN